MSGNGVNYPKVIDLLADTIKELNQPCVAPAAPAERTAEERKRDAADVLRGLLHALEGGASAGAAAGAAAAEHGASSDKWIFDNLEFKFLGDGWIPKRKIDFNAFSPKGVWWSKGSIRDGDYYLEKYEGFDKNQWDHQYRIRSGGINGDSHWAWEKDLTVKP